MPVDFIAEVSSNHDRDIDRCREFIDVAAQIGCRAVKFQLFRISSLFAPEILAKSARHRERGGWELPTAFLAPIADHCRLREIEFCCTPFYLDAVDELRPFVDSYKIASYELLWDDLLRRCAATGKPVILSTGMATMDEIGHAVAVLRESGCRDLTLLHCVSAYPTLATDANLAALNTLSDAFDCKIGWSDHSVRPAVIQRAVHRWRASTIEFHLDLEGQGAEYASGHCWLPDMMEQVIRDIAEAESADGDGCKKPAASEMVDRDWRADPSDGLRPFRAIRQSWTP